MDPNACLNALLNSRHTPEYAEHLADLIGWLNAGGFGPAVTVRKGNAQRRATLIKLSYTGYARVRYRNHRESVVRFADVDAV